mmetsp:Transcript_11941/g.31580  ORF Transcript_11941/g.31580 Transcript_11941/m.31580 type:complete len:279 (-) Transcript_11941:749-1585(-)
MISAFCSRKAMASSRRCLRMILRRAAWNSLAGSLPTSAEASPFFGVPSLFQVCRSTRSRSIIRSRPSRTSMCLTTAASSSSFTRSASTLLRPFASLRPLWPVVRSPHSPATLAVLRRPCFSCSLTAAFACFSSSARIPPRISARRASSVKVSTMPCSSHGMPSSVVACMNCSFFFTSFAKSSFSSGNSCFAIWLTVTAMMISFPPMRWPSLTFMSRASPAFTPTSCSWISGISPPPFVSPSSNFTPVDGALICLPREPPSATWKPSMSTVSMSPFRAP